MNTFHEHDHKYLSFFLIFGEILIVPLNHYTVYLNVKQKTNFKFGSSDF